MRELPETRSPRSMPSTEDFESVHLRGLNEAEIKPSLRVLQTLRLANRYGLSVRVARVVAGLHFCAHEG